MSTGSTFGDAGVWSYLLLLALIFISLLIANIIKQKVAPMRRSLIPVSVLGGLLLLIVSTVCKVISGDYLFNLPLFTTGVSRSGIETLEILTYHCLAIGFVAMTLRKSSRKMPKAGRRKSSTPGLSP